MTYYQSPKLKEQLKIKETLIENTDDSIIMDDPKIHIFGCSHCREKHCETLQMIWTIIILAADFSIKRVLMLN